MLCITTNVITEVRGYLETSDYFMKQTLEKTKEDVERFNPTLIRIFKIMDETRLDFGKVLMNCQ